MVMVSCESSENKIIDFGSFEIEVPRDWTGLEIKGIDSYVGGIVTGCKDTLRFDLGYYSNDVSTNSGEMVYDSIFVSELKKGSSNSSSKTFNEKVDSIFESLDTRKYRRYKVQYDSIDCFQVKIITSEIKGFGATGIYIDQLKKGEFNDTRFSFYGNRLSDSIQKQFLEALKSLNFKAYCK
jgi:hypothetical protein